VIGLDTNVLLRLLLRDDARQAASAEKAFASSVSRDEPAIINAVVLSEAVWAMRKVYALPKERVISILRGLLVQADVSLVPDEPVQRALAAWEIGAAEFSDYLIAEINREIGCEFTFTFDRAAARSDAFRLLPA
jgi:predicted nucleic-acid-binding protein